MPPVQPLPVPSYEHFEGDDIYFTSNRLAPLSLGYLYHYQPQGQIFVATTPALPLPVPKHACF